jgi:hypothetical protein
MTTRIDLLRQVQRDYGDAMVNLLRALLHEADQTTDTLLANVHQTVNVLRPLLIAAQLLANAVDCEADPDLDQSVADVLRHAADQLAMTAADHARVLVP